MQAQPLLFHPFQAGFQAGQTAYRAQVRQPLKLKGRPAVRIFDGDAQSGAGLAGFVHQGRGHDVGMGVNKDTAGLRHKSSLQCIVVCCSVSRCISGLSAGWLGFGGIIYQGGGNIPTRARFRAGLKQSDAYVYLGIL